MPLCCSPTAIGGDSVYSSSWQTVFVTFYMFYVPLNPPNPLFLIPLEHHPTPGSIFGRQMLWFVCFGYLRFQAIASDLSGVCTSRKGCMDGGSINIPHGASAFYWDCLRKRLSEERRTAPVVCWNTDQTCVWITRLIQFQKGHNLKWWMHYYTFSMPQRSKTHDNPSVSQTRSLSLKYPWSFNGLNLIKH